MTTAVFIVAAFALLSFVGMGAMILNWPMYLVSDRVGDCGLLVFLTGGAGMILTGIAAFIAA